MLTKMTLDAIRAVSEGELFSMLEIIGHELLEGEDDGIARRRVVDLII